MLNFKKRIPTLLLFFLAYQSSAQIPTLNPFFFVESAQKTKVIPINLTSIGKYYADLNWNAGNIYLKNGDSLIAYYMRYDLVRNHLEVIIDTKIKAINGSFIDHFEWFSISRLRPEKYVNKELTPLQKVEGISGFSELLEEGGIELFKCKMVFAPRESTSPTLVNDTDQKIQILEKYFLVKGDEWFEVVNSKKKNLDFIGKSDLESQIKSENLRFSNENDLRKIIQLANQE